MTESFTTIFCNGKPIQLREQDVYLVDEGNPIKSKDLFPDDYSPMLLFDNKEATPPLYAFFSDELARLFVRFHVEWVTAGIIGDDWSLVPFAQLESVISNLTGVPVRISKLVQYPSGHGGARWYVECHSCPD